MREDMNSWFVKKTPHKRTQEKAINQLRLLFDDTEYSSYYRSISKSRRKEIIYDALEDIDYEGFMSTNIERSWGPKVISFTWKDDGRRSTYLVKRRLRELVGTDEIRLNDRTYFDKLGAALDRENEMDQIKKEQRLKEAEKYRLRKLAEETKKRINEQTYTDVLKGNVHGLKRHTAKKPVIRKKKATC